jgi:Flp pilus assembly protein TadG
VGQGTWRNSRKPFHGRNRRGGHAAVEVALMAPWIFLLFAMVLDLGFYSYAAIATQNAARSGVMHTSRSSAYVTDLTGACEIARRELIGLPNVSSSLAVCAASPGALSDAQPIAVAVAAVAGPDATSLGAARVTVTYRTPQLFPLPGLMGRMTLTRIGEARVRDN